MICHVTKPNRSSQYTAVPGAVPYHNAPYWHRTALYTTLYYTAPHRLIPSYRCRLHGSWAKCSSPQDKSGSITIDELQRVCEQLKLPVEPELLEALLSYCDVDSDGTIDYQEFSNFLNWEDSSADLDKPAKGKDVSGRRVFCRVFKTGVETLIRLRAVRMLSAMMTLTWRRWWWRRRWWRRWWWRRWWWWRWWWWRRR